MRKNENQAELEYWAFAERWVKESEQLLKEILGHASQMPLPLVPRNNRALSRRWDSQKLEWVRDQSDDCPTLNQLFDQWDFKMRVQASMEPTLGSPLDGRTARFWQYPEIFGHHGL